MSVTESAPAVSVTPERFSLIEFDTAEIAAVVADVARRVGVTNRVRVEVDETTPLAKVWATLVDDDGETVRGPTGADVTIVIRAESGALEDTARLTTFSAPATALSMGRMLLRARDRMRADWADAPDDLSLTLAQNAAWDAYCAGRLTRVGVDVFRQRYRYNFRNRFGFSDAVDARFDELWAADDLAWSDISSDASGTVSAPPPPN